MSNSKYLVDTSILLLRNYEETYEETAYPIHWTNFDKLVEKGVIISIDEVKTELTRDGHNEYDEWINHHKYMFQWVDKSSSEFLKYLSNEFSDWYSLNMKKKCIADAPLIAYAKSNNLCLVTDEVYNYNKNTNSKNYKIPVISEFVGGKCFMKSCETVYDLNKTYDFDCICFNELVKREKLFKC